MAGIPKAPEDIFHEFTQDYKEAFGEDLKSIILYGSGARGEYVPKKSDLNFLIILTEGGMDRLKQAFSLIRKWRKRRVNIPLFLTEEYIASSLDTFPVEFLNFKDSHILVFGRDVLAEISLSKKDLRLQCEREFKAKILLLREAYLDSEGKARELRKVISASLTAFLSLFRALLYVRDREIPRRSHDLVATAAKEIGFHEAPFQELLRITEGTAKVPRGKIENLVEQYMQIIREICKTVDQLDIQET